MLQKVMSPTSAGSGEVSVAQLVPLQKKQKVEQNMKEVCVLIFHEHGCPLTNHSSKEVSPQWSTPQSRTPLHITFRHF
jgi:hypothetical protein